MPKGSCPRGVQGLELALQWRATRFAPPGRRGTRPAPVPHRAGEVYLSGAAELTLSPEEIAKLEAVSRPPLLYPYWHQKAFAADRLSAADLSLFKPHLAD